MKPQQEPLPPHKRQVETLMKFARMAMIALMCGLASLSAASASRPNVVLVMADDMGWGETSYNRHPILKTPNLDAMAASGLRFDRFYAGAPNCSPTRASVLTGRSNDRTGVVDHGYALRRQEKTLPRAMQEAGYRTAHFGKWHLNGFRGPGAPVLANDDHNPGEFGFDEWLSVTNFFDRDPLMGRKGKIEEFTGDSSEIIVSEALHFIAAGRDSGKPTFSVIWYGSPHGPFIASAEDKADFGSLDSNSQNHYGELVAMDRSIGALRRGLRDLGIAENTLVVFCSDNGGLPNLTPETVGGLRGFKNSIFEGGLRVPAIIEWPGVIKPRITKYPACTMDLFPTIVEAVGLSKNVLSTPIDGVSLVSLFAHDAARREKPIPFRHRGRAALIDDRYKLLAQNITNGVFELYDLETDPKETKNIAQQQPELTVRLRSALLEWNRSVEASVAGKDYPEGEVSPNEPESRFWREDPIYRPYLDQWKDRPELAPSATNP